MSKTITFKGSPLMLVGRALHIGALAPDFKVVSQDLKVITLSAEIAVIGISKDLPFPQKRFCQENSIDKEAVLSDYRFSSFGVNYGLLIKELNLLARSVHIIDKNDILRYSQVVPELTNPPDYEEALEGLEAVAKSPAYEDKKGRGARCRPCEAGAPPMPKAEIDKLLARHKGWQLAEGKRIAKEFKFMDFAEAKYFLDLISIVSEEEGHHPTLTLAYNKLKVTLTTHAAGGLTENDFIMARIVDDIGGGQ